MSDPTEQPAPPPQAMTQEHFARVVQAEMSAGIARGLVQGIGPEQAYNVAANIVGMLANAEMRDPSVSPGVALALRMSKLLHAHAVEHIESERRQAESASIVLAPANARVNGKRIV